MNVETEIGKYSEFVEPDVLVGLLSKPMEYLEEDVVAIIPSLTIGGDGITLSSLLLVSENYICEVGIGSADSVSFDIAERTMCNFRVQLKTQDIIVDEQIVASYETAEIALVHAFGMTTRLLYAGSERDAWVAEVRQVFPVELLLQASRS